MTFDLDDDKRLDAALDGPLLDVPDDFTARVMAALPARPAAAPAGPATRRGWRLLSALVTAACGALGAVEVLLFVSGLWTATAVAVG
jgi:hypothetical protein